MIADMYQVAGKFNPGLASSLSLGMQPPPPFSHLLMCECSVRPAEANARQTHSLVAEVLGAVQAGPQHASKGAYPDTALQ